ncbi:MAG TPA: type VI secretion system tube protein TssD [Polyangia bacterium]|nr:type VI secretion system tube protein TssD [Polyangia bacterium]
MNGFASGTLEKQGQIKGGCDRDGHKDEIEVYKLDHKVTIPTHGQTGAATSSRVHDVLVFTMNFDKSLPSLFQALASGEKMKDFTIKFFRIKGGVEEFYFSIKLENAVVVGIREYKPITLDAAFTHYEDLADVSLRYQKITWDHVADKTTAVDDWKAASK